ncbi:MAG TPA: zf-HC2 domain-containing protein [Gemmataceae bacterium]|nr:zf-HC2 domain-containing protein [Gemmataceae bacterium]
MLTCREFVDFLLAYLSGELPAGQRAVFEEHLGECPDCVTYLKSYQQTVRIEKIVCGCGDPVPADAPEELIQAVLAARARQDA